MFEKQKKMLWFLLMPFSLWGITISTDTILTKDKVYNEDVIIDENVILELNNHTLTVNGNFNIIGGRYDGGKLKMVQPKDRLIVHGDVSFNGKSSDDFLTNGVIEISGNFYQKGEDKYGKYSSYNRFFYAKDKHKVILNGTTKQIVDFEAPLSSSFNHLEIKNSSNDGVVFKQLNAEGDFVTNGNNIKVTKITNLKLTENLTFSNDVNVTGGNLDLNGNTLIVNGRLYFAGKYCHFTMKNPNDRLIVNGTLVFRGATTYNYLTEGIIEVKGNFYQVGESGTYYAEGDSEGFYQQQPDNAYSFYPTQNNKVILNGTGQQIITFFSSGTSFSRFNNLEILNDEVVFKINEHKKIHVENALYTSLDFYNSIYKDSAVLSFKKYRDINYVYLELEKGQHLISLPISNTLNKSQIETIFSDNNISYILKYDANNNKWQGYSTNETFKKKMKTSNVGAIESLTSGEGIFIDIEEAVTLKFPKSEGYNLFDKVNISNLTSGWHFLGSNKEITIEKLIQKNSNIQVLWNLVDGKWAVYSKNEDIKEEYQRREIPSFEDINGSNRAFWVYVE